MQKGRVTVVIGLQWGDEGKGKWVDSLSEDVDAVVRYQGGNNAGHSIQIGQKSYVFHLLPSAVLREDMHCVLGAGTVIDPRVLCEELVILEKQGFRPNLLISKRAHVITEQNIEADFASEETMMIGTTKRGIGPTYAAKMMRSGVRMADWIHAPKESSPYIERLSPYVGDAEAWIRTALEEGKHILAEGAQGTMLDIDFGTYPFVTSSSTLAQNFFTSCGIDPRYLQNVIGICKIYATRVGEGPFPSELGPKEAEELRALGKEFGATTGRPRRCGWLDLPALSYAAKINGCDSLIINKVDLFTERETIGVVTEYQDKDGRPLPHFPVTQTEWQQIQPRIEMFSCWKKIDPQDPDLAKVLSRIEEQTGAKVIALGTGPGRDDQLKL